MTGIGSAQPGAPLGPALRSQEYSDPLQAGLRWWGYHGGAGSGDTACSGPEEAGNHSS